MRKVLQMTFGTTTLAASCAVGCKNAKTSSLDQEKLEMIKGTQIIVLYINNYCSSAMICENFSTVTDLKPEMMNVVINSACCGARRSLKLTPAEENTN